MKLLRSIPTLACILLMAPGGLSAQETSEAGDSSGGGANDSESPQRQLVWPTEWTVFAPVERLEDVWPVEVLKTIPEKITLPAFADLPERELEAQKLEVTPGTTVDLLPFFESQAQDNTAYVFLELESPKDQTVDLGIGGDWWVEAWVNGQPVFDTLPDGNDEGNITMLNHRFSAPLKKGSNVLAVRFITGKGSSQLALGGPSEFEAARERQAEYEEMMAFTELPPFEERLVFPADTQAIATASMTLDFPEPEADLSEGSLVGLQEMPERQLYFHQVSGSSGALLDTFERRFDTPVFIRLSKFIYPWEDRALDAIVYTTPPEAGEKPAGSLEILLKSEDGNVLSKNVIDDLSANGQFFSVGFPDALQGKAGVLEAIWKDGETVIGKAEKEFQVDPPSGVADSGKIPLRILNEPGATIENAPMTVGVPFPRGALFDSSRVRLVDEAGKEIPVQTMVTGLWSRFGSVQWLLCDFTVNLKGKGTTVFLEYGPKVSQQEVAALEVTEADQGFPALDTGRIKITDQGVLFDPKGQGKFQEVLAPEALTGAFVKHEKDGRFAVPESIEHAVEELGSEKAVIRRTGWYVEPGSGEKFCQFVTRFVFHRESPVVRIFHTWIFTGDGNSDRIREMGWKFDTASGTKPEGFLKSFEGNDWLSGDYVVQFNYDRFKLAGAKEDAEGRLPGVLGATSGTSRVLFGAKDFWQNFPSELSFEKDAFTFFNWPRNNPPATFTRPVPVTEAFRSRFVHEGELLDFRVPDEYTEGEIYEEGIRREGHWQEGRPETVNAQGIARTEEMFLFFSDTAQAPEEAALVMQGLNNDTLRAIVEPAWLASTEVFGKIHPQDFKNFPEEERLIDLVYQAPGKWVERLGFYGKWLHGDYPTWNMKLDSQTVSTYRTLRKNHHTWPYDWVPFARSGDPRLLKFAETATRQMTDANFCHYASAEVDEAVGPEHFRRQGWWLRSLLPWAWRDGPTRRNYTIDTDYIWDAYHMTGYSRARDMLLLLQQLMPHDESVANGPRTTCGMMNSYIDMYNGTFDPYFLAASWEISDLYDFLYEGEGEVDYYTFAVEYDASGHGWRGEQQKWADFTRDPGHIRLALNNANTQISPVRVGARAANTSGGGGGGNATMAAFGWDQTGDPYYLGRILAELDALRTSVYEGEIEYYQGSDGILGHGNLPMRNSQWDMPGKALAAVHGAKELPDRIPKQFMVQSSQVPGSGNDAYTFEVPVSYIKKAGTAPIDLYLDSRSRRPEIYQFDIKQVDGDAEMSGDWQAPLKLTIPGDEPEGVYSVKFGGTVVPGEGQDVSILKRRSGYLLFPLAGPDVPEVMTFPRDEKGTGIQAGRQGHWFMVPEGTKEFWVEFAGRPSFRYSVWNSEGERVFSGYPTEEVQRVDIKVEPGQDGKLWRVTGGNCTIDPKIPPYFAVSRSKWFDPKLPDQP